MPGETHVAHAPPFTPSPTGCARCRPTGGCPQGATVVHVGCGTSFHAAQTGGWAVQALEAVLSPPRADIMVCVSHEGETELTMEAERAFGGDVWLVTGRADSPLAELVDEVVVCTPEIERSWCHTASYTCAVAALQALHGEEIGHLPAAVEEALLREAEPFRQERVLIIGAGRDWPTAQEAALKLREGAWVGRVRVRDRAAPARPSRRGRRVGAGVRARGRGPRRRARGRRGARARDARLRDDPARDEPSGGRHRPVPAADARRRRGARASTPTRSAARPAPAGPRPAGATVLRG